MGLSVQMGHLFTDLRLTAGLVETLKGEGPFTVFAPTDEAFAQSGQPWLGRHLPVNPWGGLVSKRHPLAASGLAMVP